MLLQIALFPCFLWLSSIPLYIRMTSLSIHLSMAFRLFSCLGYCKQCSSECRGAGIFLNYSFPSSSLALFLPCEDMRSPQSAIQKRNFTRTQPGWYPDLGFFSASRIVKYISVVYKLSSLWCSVTAD